MFNTTVGAIVTLGAPHGDEKLRNFYLVDNDIMVVGMKWTEEISVVSPERRRDYQERRVDFLMDLYVITKRH